MNWSLEEVTMVQGKKSKKDKCPGIIGWKANARPPGWTIWENAPLLQGWGGGGGGMGRAGID